eukprot:15326217-Ditylum_brightwellii.AAC.3
MAAAARRAVVIIKVFNEQQLSVVCGSLWLGQRLGLCFLDHPLRASMRFLDLGSWISPWIFWLMASYDGSLMLMAHGPGSWMFVVERQQT